MLSSSGVPQPRRKSSSFRPHNWRYPQFTPGPATDSVEESPMSSPVQVSLEMLPVVILEYIFDFLQTPDLLQVCLSSKYFYLPAVNRLYKKLIITGDDLALDYAKSHLKNWNKNYGTALSPRKVPSLVAVIGQNNKLASLIRHVIVTSTNNLGDIPSLLELAHVTTFYCTKPIDLPASLLHTVQDLSVVLGNTLVNGLTASLGTPSIDGTSASLGSYKRDLIGGVFGQLCELRICHSNTVLDSGRYEELAAALIASNTHAGLRSLVLETAGDERDLRRLNMLNQSRGDGRRAEWPSFFRVLAKAGVKLKLSTLGIDGHFENAAVPLAELLGRSIELDHLQTLELRCTEVSHGPQQHSGQATTILDELTKRTPSLRNLDVVPSDNCLTCQMDSVSCTLSQNLPHQLEQLSLVMETPIQAAAQSVRELLLQHQHKLRKLKFVDRSSLAEHRGLLYQNLSSQDVSLWEHGCFYQYRIQKAFFPCSGSMCSPEYDQAQFATDPMIQCIRHCRADLARFLDSDPIYAHAHEYMPLLKQYTVVDFTINMKENGVQYNGHTVPLPK